MGPEQAMVAQSVRKTDQSSSRLEKSTCGVRSVEENWELDILPVDLN